MLKKTTKRLIYGGDASLHATTFSQYGICRQPWNEYIRLLSKEDSAPFPETYHAKPMYRGRKRGMEEWTTGGGVQMHFSRYPDEHLFSNLTRWRYGDLVGDLAVQQFRKAQPFDVSREDDQGLNHPNSETYMKLNYKNPGTIGRFLSRTGHYYPRDVMPINPEAAFKLRLAKKQAYMIGLFPRHGNPFWFRSQQYRPKPFRGEYDPIAASTKQTMEHYCFNWLQTFRIRTYFQGIEAARAVTQKTKSTMEQMMQGGPERGDRQGITSDYEGYQDDSVPYSVKKPTVPGLLSTTGMQKPMELYSRASERRMGYPNPLGSKKL